jgi:hypothetical protein
MGGGGERERKGGGVAGKEREVLKREREEGS